MNNCRVLEAGEAYNALCAEARAAHCGADELDRARLARALERAAAEYDLVAPFRCTCHRPGCRVARHYRMMMAVGAAK